MSSPEAMAETTETPETAEPSEAPDTAEGRDHAPEPPTRLARRLLSAVQNGLEIARFGGLGEKQASPYEVVTEGPIHRLRRYFPDTPLDGAPPVLLVPPLMMTAEVWDVAPEYSAVRALHGYEIDPWVVDFGSPEQEEGGLERTLSDHVIAVCSAVEDVRAATGRDVHLTGYSQGGMFAYQAAAYLQSRGLSSLITFGSPVDLHRALLDMVPTEFVLDVVERVGRFDSSLLPSGIPRWATRLGFQLLDPIKTVQQRIEFAKRLYDREALLEREGMRRFMDDEAWTAFPGPALRDAMRQLVAHNRLLRGGVVIGDHTVTLADITVPILAFTGETDSIAPPPTVRAIHSAAPRADSYEVSLNAGHFGLVAGKRALEDTWPAVSQWIRWRDDEGPRPLAARPLTAANEDTPAQHSVMDDLVGGAEVAWHIGKDLVDGATNLVGGRMGTFGRMLDSVAPQLPRLSRLASIRSDTAISPGSAVQEKADESGDDTFFLFDGRAYNYRESNVRIDNIVRGLLSCGIRHGDHVGLLMDTRPSAVASAVALSRLGAVVVLLRPDVSLKRQLELTPIDHLLADPELAEHAHKAFGREVLVLGGGGDPRSLADGLIDMEAIDPDEVTPPDWYRPNPGRAGELAMVFITGDGDRLGMSRVTNRRWATSAYGTASATALTSRDTVYCVSPTHHATGMLVCVGGALVSGARLAMGRGFDLETFWGDVRRYGVNVVFYSGTLLRTLVNAPRDATERDHPIRLFAGSGMPQGLWHRVVERFRPAPAIEFFASTEGNAVLVNLTGEKIGSVGRPLPGGADLSIAAWDLDRGALVERGNGFAERCKRGGVGLLLAEISPERGEVEGRPLRGVFEPGDAWLDTGDLVRRDRDGDYWLVDHVSDVIQTRTGGVATIPIEDLIATEVEYVDLIAVYGVQMPGDHFESIVAAITLRPGHKFEPRTLRKAVDALLPKEQRPTLIRVLDELPTTSGHRIRKRPLREEGWKKGSGKRYRLDPNKATYVRVKKGER